MNTGVSVTFRFGMVGLGKAIVLFTPEVCVVHSSTFDRAAVRVALGIEPALAGLVVVDLVTRALLVAGHFRHLNERYPFSIDPASGIEAQVKWINPEYLPQ